jgi:hypothetical protein
MDPHIIIDETGIRDINALGVLFSVFARGHGVSIATIRADLIQKGFALPVLFHYFVLHRDSFLSSF